MISAHATHPGLVRQNNEDCIRTDDNLGIYLLADGIGGHNAGEVASSLAVETAYTVLRSNITHTEVDGYFELLVHAMQTAHWEIVTKAQSHTSYNRMGTTLVVAVLREDKAYIVNAGDSRCYLYQNGSPPPHLDPFDDAQESSPHTVGGTKFKRLTNDHTVGDQLLASGICISQIPKKKFHTLTKSVGCGDPPYPDFSIAELKLGDLILICSDGLTDMLSDSEIEAIISNGGASLDTLAEDLVNAANANGGRDNISIVLVAAST
jgi:protein phosphatase